MERDEIWKVTALEGKIRIFLARTTDLTQIAANKHATYPVATAALGRTLTAASILGVMSKNEKDTITLRINGNGPIGMIIAIADSKGIVRGYVNEPQVEVDVKYPGKLNVGQAVGDGMLYIIRDLGLKEPYVGSSPLISGEIADDLTSYFFNSEQTPTSIGLGVLIDIDGSVLSAGGFLLQLLPGLENEETIQQLEKNIKMIPNISDLLDMSDNLEDILKLLCKGFSYTIHEKIPVSFQCTCSKERLGNVLQSLGKEEIIFLQSKEDDTEIICHFCNTPYTFNKNELQEMLDNMEND
ncbi:MAG: Hsp33 family molecular chaperone HslO [Clostridia bacterium]